MKSSIKSVNHQRKYTLLAFLIAAIVSIITGCTQQSTNTETPPMEPTTQSESDGETANQDYPITIKHAFGETVIEKKPERVATIAWGNHDVPLALGLVPIGVSTANYGVQDGSGLLPWTLAAFKGLGVESPTLYNDLTELDYEGIKASNPDVILAAYSGITEEEYGILSEIAPVVAYPTAPWQTYWRDQILVNATGLGLASEGQALVASLESIIEEQVKAYPQLSGKTAAFFYFNPADLGKFYIYLPTDPRAAFLEDLGFIIPNSVKEQLKTATSFAIELSAENAHLLEDVDVIVAYGDQALLELLQQDPLLGGVKAIKNGAVALIADNTPLAAAATQSALSIPATLPEYLRLLGAAAELAND